MSWQDDAMAEQEQADALFGMGEAEWRDTFEERHGWAPDYDYEILKTNERREKDEQKHKRIQRKILEKKQGEDIYKQKKEIC